MNIVEIKEGLEKTDKELIKVGLEIEVIKKSIDDDMDNLRKLREGVYALFFV